MILSKYLVYFLLPSVKVFFTSLCCPLLPPSSHLCHLVFLFLSQPPFLLNISLFLNLSSLSLLSKPWDESPLPWQKWLSLGFYIARWGLTVTEDGWGVNYMLSEVRPTQQTLKKITAVKAVTSYFCWHCKKQRISRREYKYVTILNMWIIPINSLVCLCTVNTRCLFSTK